MDKVEIIRAGIKAGLYPTRAMIRKAADRIITSYQDGYDRGKWDAWVNKAPRQFGTAISPMAEGYKAGYEEGLVERAGMMRKDGGR